MNQLLKRYEQQAHIFNNHHRLGRREHVEMDEIMQMAAELASGWKPDFRRIMETGEMVAAGGTYYQDSRSTSFSIADQTAVSPVTTAVVLWPVAVLTPTSQLEWWAGKKFHLRVFGRMTTGATPGNLTFSTAFGTASNTGILSSSAALTLIASQTNLSWRCEAYIDCRAVGTAGSLFATGVLEINPALVAAAQGLIPASAPAAVAVDTTAAANGLNMQAARSGSTAETMQIHQILFAALN